MSEQGDLNQTIVEEGGTEQERATPENGIVKSESLDEEEKLELQVSLEKKKKNVSRTNGSIFFLLFWDNFEGLFLFFLKSLISKMNRKFMKLILSFPNY